MPTTVIGGEKGGTAKSAVSCNLAICMALQGLDVLLIDGDAQRTSAQMMERRDELARADPSLAIARVPIVEKRGDMATYLENVAAKHDHIIVDIRGADTPQMSSALLFADQVFSPFTPGISSLETSQKMSHAIDMALARGNRSLKSRALLTLIDPRSGVASQVTYCRQILDPFEANLSIAETVLLFYGKAYQNATARGVVELVEHHPARDVRKAAAKPAAALWKLYAEVTGKPVPAGVITEETHEDEHAIAE